MKDKICRPEVWPLKKLFNYAVAITGKHEVCHQYDRMVLVTIVKEYFEKNGEKKLNDI